MAGRGLAIAVGLLALGACRQDMQNQPKYLPLRPSPFFTDGRTSRPVVEGTIPRGQLDLDPARTTGKVGKQYAPNPLPPTATVFARGRERYDIFCSPCHDRVGAGNGMIVERGFKQPPTFHQDRLREIPDGYFVEVVSQGFGVMLDYAQQIPVDDRWAIAAWIRVLQRSQDATLADVPTAERARLDAAPEEKRP
ncbi:MAG: c-type cytochrome [Candidatus Binatia bacterium]